MTYSWLVAGLPSEARGRIDGILTGPEPEDPDKAARENAATFGKLFALQGQGLR